MTATAFSSPFSDNVANDIYSGSPNGIPTAFMAISDPNLYVPNIYEAINKILGTTTYSTNADVDHLFMDNDSLWFNFGGNATVIGYSAYYYNTLGVYTADGSNDHDVLIDQYGYGFAYDSTIPGYPTASIGVLVGTVFGWYLEVNTPNGYYLDTYYSESAHNTDGYDHMMTFDLGGPLTFDSRDYENPCLIAWEDNPWDGTTLGDEDYNDLIFLVDAKVVPEPATVLLLGSGLLGLAGLGRKRAKRAFKNS